MHPALLPSDARRAERRRVGIRAHLRESGTTRLDVEVRDLSITGFRIENIYSIAIGARIFLTIPSFSPLEAEIAWRRNMDYGCKFLRPLHPAVFETICSRYPDR